MHPERYMVNVNCGIFEKMISDKLVDKIMHPATLTRTSKESKVAVFKAAIKEGCGIIGNFGKTVLPDTSSASCEKEEAVTAPKIAAAVLINKRLTVTRTPDISYEEPITTDAAIPIINPGLRLLQQARRNWDSFFFNRPDLYNFEIVTAPAGIPVVKPRSSTNRTYSLIIRVFANKGRKNRHIYESTLQLIKSSLIMQ